MHEFFSLGIFKDTSDITDKGRANLNLAKTILLCVIGKKYRQQEFRNLLFQLRN
jgi:hypothetical protein